MLKYTTGIICTPITTTIAEALQLPLMVPDNNDPYRTAFTVTVDYRHGTVTGVSANDRMLTIQALSNYQQYSSDDFTRPGHIFPLLYRDGGVLVRSGHTEAGVDLSRLAEAGDVSYLCELYNHNTGNMYRFPDLQILAKELSLPLISIADLQRYRYRREKLVSLLNYDNTIPPTLPNSSLSPEITKLLTISSSSSTSPSSSTTTSFMFQSMYYPDQYYSCKIDNIRKRKSNPNSRTTSDEEQEEIEQPHSTIVANPNTTTTKPILVPRIHIHFQDINTTIHKMTKCTLCSIDNDIDEEEDDEINEITSTSTESSTNSKNSHTCSICIHVYGKPYDNVKGKESSHLDPIEQEKIKQQKLIANTNTVPQPTAYTDLFPAPLHISEALQQSTYNLYTISDRVTAELGQIISNLIKAYQTKLSLSTTSTILTKSDILIEPIITTKTNTTDSLANIYTTNNWSHGTLIVEPGQPIPRVWEYGIIIDNMEI